MKKLDNYQLKNKSTSFIINIVKFLFLAGMCYLFVFPILYLIVSAIQDPATANDPTIVWVPKNLSFTSSPIIATAQ